MSFHQPGLAIQPLQVQIDFNQAVWEAYRNAYNSFQILEMDSQGRGATAWTHVPVDRFQGNVGILWAMILESWKDDEFKKITEDHDVNPEYPNPDNPDLFLKDMSGALAIFKAITELLHRRGFFEQRDQVSLLK